MTCASLFNKASQAAHYSLHRPKYPSELYQAILSHCSGRSLAVDIATGSGQAAGALAGAFERVIAQDASTQQLNHADRQAANVEYQEADAHHTGLPAHCADLVTVAQALHWFDTPRFYREVRRILKPDGCFAAWTYNLPTLNSKDHPATAVLQHLYEGVLGPYWAAGRRHVELAYTDIQPVQGQEFGSVQRLVFEAPLRVTADDVVGFVKSWSAYHTFLEQHPDQDPMPTFRQDLLSALNTQDGSHELDVSFPITLVLAKDPLPLQPSDAAAGS